MLKKLVCLTGLLLAFGPLNSARAHQGVSHGKALHQRVAGVDVLLELKTLGQYKQQFGTTAGLKGTHVVVVRLLDGHHPLVKAELKSQLTGPGQKLMGPVGGSVLPFFQGTRQHFALGYNLSKGRYGIKVMLKAGSRSAVAAFTADAG